MNCMTISKKVLSFMDEINVHSANYRLQILETFERQFGFYKANFWRCDNELKLIDPITLNTEPSVTSDYVHNFSHLDLLTPLNVINRLNSNRVINLFDIQTSKDYENSVYYNEFMKKYGFYNNLAIFLINDNKIIGAVDFVWPKEEKIYHNTDLIFLEIISRYLSSTYSYFLKDKDSGSDVLNFTTIDLTTREKEILKLVKKGFSNKEIGSALFISVNTVKKHMQNLYMKFDVSNRTQLTAESNKLGI